ncbi:glycosyltransferase family 9 protein [Olivibacter ginsenosidimutans]|uniref:Glycosyltransferase family 9 protein n=1 Tax=Olivibacter ginsenosidimutans TaxID=1176537 RepID=A0ABP9BAK6_9SPHI
MTEIKKIAFLRALQLGDFLCTVPAIRTLRKAYPKAIISWIGLPHMAHLAKRFAHYIDEFIPFPGYPGLPEQPIVPEAILHFIQEMQRRRFDLALQLQGNGTHVNDLLSLFKANKMAGFYSNQSYKPPDGGFMLYPEHLHEIDRHLALMKHLKLPIQETALEFPIAMTGRPLLDELGLEPQTYICFHAGSRGKWRQWPPRHFAYLADHCMKLGYRAVFTGTRDEQELVANVASYMHNKPIIVAGKTSLDELAILLKQAKGLVSNCTGVAHLAYALEIPTVTISMDGEPYRWGPPKNNRHVLIDWLKTPIYEKVEASCDLVFNLGFCSNLRTAIIT